MVMSRAVSRVRRSGPNPATEPRSAGWWDWRNRYTTTTASKPVNDIEALSIPAFYRGVTLIATVVASLPLHVYEKAPDGSAVQPKAADTAYIWRAPNVEQSRQSFWERIAADEVRGNAFIFVVKTPGGEPESLWHIQRKRVRVGRAENGMKVYLVDGDKALIDYRQGGEIVHIANWGDGIVGYDPVDLAQQALSLGLSAEEYAAQSFATGQVPPGIITTDMELSIQEANDLLALWKVQHAGIKNSQEVGFLGHGAKFQQLSVDLDKMQMETLRRFQVQEIARLLGLPPFLLGDMTGASQGGGQGMEEQNRMLITFTLQPHLSRIEQAIDDALLVEELTGRYAKLDLRGLLRGSTLQRYQAYALGYGRWLTASDIRELEDMPPVDGDELLLAASNLVPAEQLGQAAAQPPAVSQPAVGAPR